MWLREHRLIADVDPAKVWQHWVDPNFWPGDDPKTAAAHFDGPPRVGTVGWVKPVNGPRVRLKVTRCDLATHRFDVTSWLPAAHLVFEHELEPHDKGWSLIHRIRITGVGSALWGPTVGNGLVDALPTTMRNIADASAAASSADAPQR